MSTFNPQNAEPVSLDLTSMFGAPKITTDEHGVHRDADGREYRAAADSDGELTFEPVATDDTEVVTPAAGESGGAGGHGQPPTGGVAGGGHVTSWEPPSWADTATAGEDGRIEYYRPLGTIFPGAMGQAPFSVAVAQVDTVTAAPDVVVVERGAAEVSMLGISLTPGEARQLGALLVEGAELAAQR